MHYAHVLLFCSFLMILGCSRDVPKACLEDSGSTSISLWVFEDNGDSQGGGYDRVALGDNGNEFYQAKLPKNVSLEDFVAPIGPERSFLVPLFFNTDDYLINGLESKKRLRLIANYLLSHPKVLLCVDGHCDQRGSAGFNQGLSAKRADVVRDFLINLGVEPQRVFTVAFGSEKPIDPQNSSRAWAKNRRIEFRLWLGND